MGGEWRRCHMYSGGVGVRSWGYRADVLIAFVLHVPLAKEHDQSREKFSRLGRLAQCASREAVWHHMARWSGTATHFHHCVIGTKRSGRGGERFCLSGAVGRGVHLI